ncbi:FtsW/RodA/SpoVE family cell cycle protein [bacterium]|nr:FtsW/RodA/SpoVE family cell cycle protein [bacterium]
MIPVLTRPLQRERLLLGMAVLVVLAGFYLTLLTFSDASAPAVAVIRFGSFSRTLDRTWGDRLLGIVFAVAAYLTYFSIRRKRRSDFIVFPVMICLTGLGLVQLFRLGFDLAAVTGTGRHSALAYYQMIWVILGLAVFSLTVRLTTYRVIHRLSRLRYTYVIAAVLLIAGTLAFGVERAGRTLSMRIAGFEFMPVELVKIFVVLFASAFFGQRGVVDPHGYSRRNALPYLIMAALVLGLLVIQKDIGPLIIMFGVLAAMYGTATGRWLRVAAAAVFTMGLAGTAYMLDTPSIVRTRFDMWLKPFELCEQAVRAFWAQSAGGLLGTGWGQGSSFRIPEVHSDFNFVVFAEELGFAGSAVIIMMYAVFCLAGLSIALRTADPFRRLAAVGISTMIFLQTFVIVAGDTGLLPLTGITLPFISYGGSSLLTQFFQAGLLYRIACADRERES